MAAEAPRLPPYLAFTGLTQSSGLTPLEVSQPSASGPPTGREVSLVPGSRAPGAPAPVRPAPGARGDTARFPGGAVAQAGAGRARWGPRGGRGGSGRNGAGPRPGLQEVVGLLINLAIERRNKVCKDGSQVNAAYSCKTNLVYAICQAEGPWGSLLGCEASVLLPSLYPSPL